MLADKMSIKRYQFKNGRLKVQRIGPLNPQRQKNYRLGDKNWDGKLRGKNRRAPENRGLWAFPYPYFDAYFASFQYDMALPKKFRRQSINELHQEMQAITGGQASHPQYAAYDEALTKLYAELHEYTDSASFKKKMQVREFWVSGSVYTHIGRTNTDSEWGYMTVSALADELSKLYARDARYAGANLGSNHTRPFPRSAYSYWAPGMSVDHLEIFLGRGAIIH